MPGREKSHNQSAICSPASRHRLRPARHSQVRRDHDDWWPFDDDDDDDDHREFDDIDVFEPSTVARQEECSRMFRARVEVTN